MKKKILIISIILFASFVVFYKYKQNQFLEMSEPQIETEKSIISYAGEHNVVGDIYIPKSERNLDSLKRYFNYGTIFVFDKEFNLLDCNYVEQGGRCFQDISNDLCDSKRIERREFERFGGNQLMIKLLENAENISNDDTLKINEFDRIYVYTWVKYAKASVYPSSIEFMECIKPKLESKKARLISLNLDQIE